MLRAKVLLLGPRKAFSVENLSPIETLGIHARSDAERRKYAEMFVRAFRSDVERSRMESRFPARPWRGCTRAILSSTTARCPEWKAR